MFKRYVQDKDKRKAYNKAFREKWHLLVISELGGKCCQCGFTDVRALQIDHINGGGRDENPSTGPTYYKKILDSLKKTSETKYQLLCANCNYIKRYTHFEIKNLWNK